MSRITSRPTRSIACWTRWRSTAGTRRAPRRSSCGAPVLRVSEVLELEWRDLDYSGDPGDAARPEVEEPAGSDGADAR